MNNKKFTIVLILLITGMIFFAGIAFYCVYAYGYIKGKEEANSGVYVELPEEILYNEVGDLLIVERNDNDTLVIGFYYSQN